MPIVKMRGEQDVGRRGNKIWYPIESTDSNGNGVVKVKSKRMMGQRGLAMKSTFVFLVNTLARTKLLSLSTDDLSSAVEPCTDLNIQLPKVARFSLSVILFVNLFSSTSNTFLISASGSGR